MLPPIGRIGLAGSWATEKRDMSNIIERASCNLANGDLYQYPNASSTVDGTQPLTIIWNTNCDISSSTVDLYLYSTNSANGLIQAWTNADYKTGQYTVNLQPKWWNNTASARLQMNIIQSGRSAWDGGTGPAGPVFTVNYPTSAMTSTTSTSATAQASQSGDAVFQNVANTNQSAGISKGAIAAAVIVPILVIAALIAVAVRFWRLREKEKRRRWSQAMSSHSNLEWEKGALPGEKGSRPSMGGNRPSMASGRPSMTVSARPMSIAASSVLAGENMAGAGAAAQFRPQLGLRSASADHIASVRSSLVMPDGQVRQSRISFADAARPERQSRNSLGGDVRPNVYSNRNASKSTNDVTPLRKAYATGSAIEDEEDMNVSPSQMNGPGGFGDAEMRRAAKGGKTGRRSFLGFGAGQRRDSQISAVSAEDFKSAASARGSQDELRDLEAVMLARRSMISGKSSPAPDTDDTEALSPIPMPSPQMPTAPSPIAGSSTVAYGPDQLLAVYATRAKSSPGLQPTPSMPAAGVSLPKPSQSKMRLLTGLKRDKSEKNVPTISSPIISPPMPSPGFSEGSRYDDEPRHAQ